MYPETNTIKQLIESAKNIVIIQADNPDGDSLGSSLALEQILAAMNKDTTMVCAALLPSYLQYFPGWDRVDQELPSKFDLSIIVDTSAISLLDNFKKQKTLATLSNKPCIVLDHHQSEPTINFATARLNVPTAAATAEVIYELATNLAWKINLAAKNALTAGILSDSLGLTANNTTARTVHIIGDLVDGGVSLSALENARRDTIRKSPEIVHYKGQLLQRVEYYEQNKLALLSVPWDEIEKYSPLYNPSVLALDDMRLTTGTVIAIVIKIYKDGKLTGKIRSNYGYPIAAKLAEKFGGGGHDYASGFKITTNIDIAQLKQEIIQYVRELLDDTL